MQASDIVTIPRETWEGATNKFKFALVGFVFGVKPFLGRVRGFARSKWGDESVVSVSQLNEGIFLLNFKTEEMMVRAISGGPWTFDNRPFILKQWAEDEDYKCGSIDALPVWIRLPGIKAHLADPSILGMLCSKLGRPICTDGITGEGLSYNYARVCVEVYAEVDFQDVIEFRDPYGNLYVQPVIYEWKPPRCVNCFNYGHVQQRCPEPSLEMMIDGLKEKEERDRKIKFKNKIEFNDCEKDCVEETILAVQGEKDHQLANEIEGVGGQRKIYAPLSRILKLRGLNHPSKKSEVREWIRRDRLSCVVLVEVKLQEDRWASAIDSCCPSSSWKGVCSEVFDDWARILLLWDEEVVQISQIVRKSHFICCKIKWDSCYFNAGFVYASNIAANRASMWKELEVMIRSNFGSWVCMGDFNCVLNPDEKRNGVIVNEADIADLKDFVSNCGFSDIPASGHFFSWSNNNSHPSQRIWCKLDRAMVNDNWINAHPNASAVFLPPGISDHCPVMVSWGEEIRRKTSFRYCNFWEDLDGYQLKVSQCWNFARACRNLFNIQSKLKAMKLMMKEQFVKSSRGMEKRVDDLRKELGIMQSLVEQHPTDQLLLQKEACLASDFRKLKEHQILFYQQRAKIRWLKEGDSNSKYFYSFLKGRRNMNNISLVKGADGIIYTEPHSIKAEFVNFFKSILAESTPCRPVDPVIINRGKKIEDSQCRPLISEASDKEIWLALSRIGSDKSPGPDGFSASFFRENWNLIGKELCAAIRHCLKFNALPKGLNAAVIALIPKSKTASEPGDYRPIACCNVVYKVVSGLLAEQLKTILPGLIDKAQGAFVQGRSIVGNVCLAQQIISGYDDLFLFSNGRCSSIEALKEGLDSFLQCAGLAVNSDKSQLFLAGFSEAKKSWIERLIMAKSSAFPVRYLGFPLTTKNISSHDCSAIVQRLTGRLNCWSNHFLSRAGGRLLIISVLQAIVFYWARICLLPKKVLKAVNSICARFLWSGKASGRGCHLLDWQSACSDKKEGGLGIKNLDTMNDAMVMNQLWDLNKDQLNVWSDWIKAYWTKGTHWWENDNLKHSSWVLRRLAHCKKLTENCTEVVAGRLVWTGEGDGFNVKDTYRSLKAHRCEVDWYKIAWNRFNSPRASFNAVLVARDRLLTKSRLRSMTMNVDPKCALCKTEDETRDHLFFQCTRSRDIVDMVLNALGVNTMPAQWHLLIPWFNCLNQKRIRTRMIAAAISATMYEIWCARNNVIFRDHMFESVTIGKSIIWGLKIKIGGVYNNLSNLEIQDRNWLNSLRWS
ncbi:hypothetical protein QQ045_004171 [Rhodiola kirilowii]